MLNNFGAAYTLKNIEDENYIELQMLQICLNSVEKAQEWQSKKDHNTKYMANFKSGEFQ